MNSQPNRTISGPATSNPTYRGLNLAANHIYLHDDSKPLPKHITKLLKSHIHRNPALPKALSPLQHAADASFLPDRESPSPVIHVEQELMLEHAIPNTSEGLRLSTPAPDVMFGYNGDISAKPEAFPSQDNSIRSLGVEPYANRRDLMYPCLLIEYGEADNTMAARNKCLGGSAACVNMVERLNERLRQSAADPDTVREVNSAAFSVAIDDSGIRFYVTWKQDKLDYHMAQIHRVARNGPKAISETQKFLANVKHWARTERLGAIRKALDTLEEHAEYTSQTSQSIKTN